MPHLTRILESDPRPLIRQHTAWSLGKLGGPKNLLAQQKLTEKDPDPAVREEPLISFEVRE